VVEYKRKRIVCQDKWISGNVDNHFWTRIKYDKLSSAIDNLISIEYDDERFLKSVAKTLIVDEEDIR
jgi:hypothetical protein